MADDVLGARASSIEQRTVALAMPMLGWEGVFKNVLRKSVDGNSNFISSNMQTILSNILIKNVSYQNVHSWFMILWTLLNN